MRSWLFPQRIVISCTTAVVLLLPGMALADSDILGDSTSDMPDNAYDMSSISYGHDRGKLAHYVALESSWSKRELGSNGDMSMTLHLATGSNKTKWNYRFQAVWSNGKKWWDYDRGLWAEVSKKKQGKWRFLGRDKMVRLNKVGTSLEFPFKARLIGKPKAYGISATVVTSSFEKCESSIGICWDDAGESGGLVHQL